MTIVTSPRSATRAITSRTARAPSGSRFAVGSSRRRTRGRSARIPAIARRCFSPPESAAVARSSLYAKPTSASAVDARPDLGGGDASILETEGDVVAGARHDELRVRVLEHETGIATDAKLALLVRRAGPVE